MTYRVKTIRVALTVQEPVSVVSSPAQAENVLRPIFERRNTDREHFVLLALNAQNHIVGYKVVSTGGAAASIVDPKTLFRDTLLRGAVSLILAHNHPSDRVQRQYRLAPVFKRRTVQIPKFPPRQRRTAASGLRNLPDHFLDL